VSGGVAGLDGWTRKYAPTTLRAALWTVLAAHAWIDSGGQSTDGADFEEIARIRPLSAPE